MQVYGLGSETISIGAYLVTKLICESSLTMYVRNPLTFLLSWAISIGIGSARLAAFYIHSPHENMEILEKFHIMYSKHPHKRNCI